MKVLRKEYVYFSVLAVLCAIVLSVCYALTKERIATNREMEKLQIIAKVMTPDFDNDIYKDVKVISYTDEFGNKLTSNVYRARKYDKPVGVVFMPILATGYNGSIQLSIGVLRDGSIVGVRVLSHRETEGLGGNIHQDNTDWLQQFAEKSLDDVPIESWALKDESGVFDQLSGATITSRSVINAIKNNLQLYLNKQDTLFLN